MQSAPERAGRPGAGLQTRRDVFLLKADIEESDERLRALRRSTAPDSPPRVESLERAIETAAGVSVSRVHQNTKRGTFRWVVAADLADGRSVVLRLHRISHPALVAGLALEGRLGPTLRGHGIRAPAAIAIDDSCSLLPAEFGVFERFEGPSLSSRDDDEQAVHAGLRSLGAWLARVHEVRVAGSGPLIRYADERADEVLRGRFASWGEYLRCRLADHVGRCVSIGAIDAGEAGRIRILLDAPPDTAGPADRLLHGDPGSDNVILSPDGSVFGLTDWEDALAGDPLFELASAACFHPERRWPHLFEGYTGSRDLTPDAGRRFWFYVLRIALARTVMRDRFGVMDLPGRKPAADRIRRALGILEGRAA